MASLRAHLLEPHRHPRLPFHPDCPHCQASPSGTPAPEPRVTGRVPISRGALTATLLAGSALTVAAAVPTAQAQVEEETEGTEQIDEGGETSPDYEHAPEDTAGEREVPDAVLEPPAETPQPQDDEGPADTAPGVLNAPAPTPPPATPPRPPIAQDGPAVDQAPRVGAPERPLGRQPQPPARRPHSPELRRERPGGPPDASPRLQPRSPSPGAEPLDAEGGTAIQQTSRPSPSGPGSVGNPQIAPPPGATTRPPGSAATYRIRLGDSLWSIAATQLGPGATAAQVAAEVTRLWELNDIRIGTGDPDLVLPGTTLRLR